MPEFADSLFDRYPLPPPPEPQGTDLIGAFFGAAPDRTKSYSAGLDAGSQYRLRSAQGEKALEEAGVEREKRLQAGMANALRLKVQKDPNYAPTVSEMLLISNGANDFTQARGGYQEQGFRSTLGDPAAPQASRFAAGEAIQGKVMPQTQALGAGREIDLMTQEASTNPLGTSDIAQGEASIGADNALRDLRNRTDPNIRSNGAGGAGGGPRLPAGAMKIIDDATLAMGAADESEGLARDAIKTIATSGVNLGLADNLINRGKNFIGKADPASMAYAGVQQTFEKLRNNYLLLAKGVQTEGDAIRAWNSEIGEAAAYDNELATQQLEKALTLIDMNRQLQGRRIDGVYYNYGQTAPPRVPLTVDPAAPANPAAPAAAQEPMRSTSLSGKAIISTDGGATWSYE